MRDIDFTIITIVNYNDSKNRCRFIEVVRELIQEKYPDKLIVFDNLIDFSTDRVISLEEKMVEIPKEIRGEIPLAGLVERVDKVLDSLKVSKNAMRLENIMTKANCNIFKNMLKSNQ